MPNNPTIYQYQACPFCFKVKALLDYKGVSYRVVEVNPLTKNEIDFSQDYQKVPIFIDASGQQVNDSTVIMRHIEKKYPQRSVFETGKEEKEVEDYFLVWGDDVLAPALVPLVYQNFQSSWEAFSYISEVSNFSPFVRGLVRLLGSFIMTLVAKKKRKSLGISDPVLHFTQTLSFLAKELKTKPFLGGDHLNAADLANYGILKSVQSLKLFRYVEQNALVWKWFTQVEKAIQQEKQSQIATY